MRVGQTTVNFRLSCVVTMATCLLFSHLPFASGQQESQVPNRGRPFSKRDGGVKHCQYNARNCPPGLQMKRGILLLENLRNLLPSSYDSRADRASSLSDPEDISSSSSSSAYSSPLSVRAVDGSYPREDNVNRDLLELLTASAYDQSERRRSW